MMDITQNISEFFTQFHFLRPLWLAALVPGWLGIWLLARRQQRSSQWHQLIDPELQSAMIESQQGAQLKNYLLLLAALWACLLMAAAGPTWQKQPQPVVKNQDALFILVDMSYSMAAEDVSPSRSERALQKVTDILNARKDGLTGLVSYAGQAYTVTPLTTDTDTILNLLPSLSPFIMPQPGSRPDRAIELAQQLARDSGTTQAKLLLITDGLLKKDIDRIDNALDERSFELAVLGLGTEEGAPIPLPTGGFLKDPEGSLILAQVDYSLFSQLRQQLGIQWRRLSLLDDDWQSLIGTRATSGDQPSGWEDPQENPSASFDLWVDQGHWLMLLALPMLALSFRRGLLFSVALIAMSGAPQASYALEWQGVWQDLWQTPDQQGAQLLESDPAAAASTFENPAWQGSANYQAGDFKAAVQAFSGDDSPSAQYNLGNALAKSGQLQEALAAYDSVLAQNPNHQDAKTNRAIVQQALDQQQQNQQQENEQKGGEESERDNHSKDPSQSGQQEDSSGSHDHPPEDSSTADADRSAEENTSQDERQGKDSESSESEDDNPSEASADSPSEQQEAPESEAEQAQTELAPNPEAALEESEKIQLQQWLNRVPDQPGKLLERKFLYQYSQQQNADDLEEQLW